MLKNNNPFYNYKNPNSELGFDIPNSSMFAMLKKSAQAHPKAIAIEYYNKKITYSELLKKIIRASHAYYKYGVRRGNAVGVLMPNTPEAVVSIYALNRLGALCDIIHPLSSQDEIKSYLVNSKCRFLLCVDKCVEKLKNIFDDTYLEGVIVATPCESMGALARSVYKAKNKIKLNNKQTCVKWTDFLKAAGSKSPEHLPTQAQNKQPSVILHSGGTTGDPKSIMLSDSSFNAFAIQAVLTLEDVATNDKVLGILPIFHGFGLGVCVHVCLCFGACSVLVPLFDAKKFGSIIKKHKPTMLFGVPTLYEALLNAKGLDGFDLSFLKYAISGGDSLNETLEGKVNAFFKAHNSNVKLCEGYGMTEGLAALSLSVNGAYKSGTIGKPLVGNKMCVVKAGTTNVLDVNQVGELCVYGPTVMIGYLNNPAATADALKIHSDGRLWLHTGDVAVIDENGIVTYKSRLKRMIVSSGYNIYPDYIEKIIEELPEVSKCVVVAMYHQYKKQVAKAYIVLENGFNQDSFTLEKIKKYCKKKLSSYSLPYEYEFVKELAKTPFGKIDYVKLQIKN